MKNIYYLAALAALAFSACQKEPALHSVLPSEKKDLTITLQQSDYQLLTSGYPKTTFTFDDDADAETYIPQILNSEYGNLDNGSTAAVTYAKSALYFKPAADSVYSDVAYTLTAADYLLLPGNKYSDFSVTQLLAWLPYKYTAPVNNQLVLITWTPYPATLSPAPPYSFLYYNGAWKQIYTVTPAEYTAIGLGKYDQITTTNNAQLHSTLAAFLKSDLSIQDTVKAGDLEFVSFDFYGGGNFQRVVPLYYDGTNYIDPPTTTGLVNFIKQSGKWIFVQPLPVINYTLTKADDAIIAASTFGTAALRTNLGSYGDFETSWAKADLQGAFILCLTKDFPSPVINTIYRVHYPLYSGGSDVDTTLDFQWNGTAWVAQ